MNRQELFPVICRLTQVQKMYILQCYYVMFV